MKERGTAVSAFNEVSVAGGRIDLTVNILGRNYIVELKMCGPGYSRSYAEGGFQQLKGYMQQTGIKQSFLVVFDGRVQQTPLPPEVDPGNDMTAFSVAVNVLGLAANRGL